MPTPNNWYILYYRRIRELIAIKHAKIVTPDAVLDGSVVYIKDGRILEICEEERKPGTMEAGEVKRTIDAHGRYLMPGFIDIHSDRIEQFILPRATAQMDFELALKECERELLHQGITTMYHSFSMYRDEFLGKSPLRTRENVEKMARLIQNIHNRRHLIHHRCHLRIEVDFLESFPIVQDMIDKQLIHEISFMDHSPGQGQYRSLEVYKKTVLTYGGKESAQMSMEEILDYHHHKEMLSMSQMEQLTSMAHAKGLTVASHDDDTVDKLEVNEQIGVDISEFPINLETARAAREKGFYTVVGAPNILLGGSHSGNMSAAEAVLDGCADILCSDYYPPAILHGIFHMYQHYGCSLPELVKKATLNPARAMGLDEDYGSIEAGKKADLLVVEMMDGYPVITHVLVDGNPTSRVEYRR